MKAAKRGLAVALAAVLTVSGMSIMPAQAARALKFSKSKLSVTKGSTVKLTVKNATKKTKVTWKTANKKIAQITKKTSKGAKIYAQIKGMKAGKTKVTASYRKGNKTKKLTCTVTVNNKKSKPSPSPAPTSLAPSGTTAPQATATPEVTVKPEDYSYFNKYTLGYRKISGEGEDEKGIVVAYQNGKEVSLEEAGAEVYNKESDDIFGQYFSDNKWDDEKLTLAPPMQYTTEDGVAHEVGGMLTNFNFIADPTAIDNSENDGKLYVYGTTEGIDYDTKGVLAKNSYNNHSLTILSTKDMVNWTDEGTLDNQNLTNKTSTAKMREKVANRWAGAAWAPSGLKIDGDKDGKDEYYLFYTNGAAVGYVQGDSPTGPWKDDLGEVLFSRDTKNCGEVKWCFDPAVLVDDKGDAYVYFGGGVWNDKGEAEKHPDASIAHPLTARVCKIKFEEGTGKVLPDGEPQVLDNYYMYEDSEINQINGKYYYSYCTNREVPAGDKWTGSQQIAVYVSSDPMNISFDPAGKNGDKFTDENNVYHHYLGTVLTNPSKMYGEFYNNHHHMQTFKNHSYIFYHSTALGNALFRDNNKKYRNLHVDEIQIDKDTDEITIEPTYEGPSQVEKFNPYKIVNATTAAKSGGVKSTRDDIMVEHTVNGSPMVLDRIDTGDWTCIEGVDFGSNGLKNFGVEYLSKTKEGRIEMFIDKPMYLENKVAEISIDEKTAGNYKMKNTALEKAVTGVHDVYFVFRGKDYKVASWLFSEKAEGENPDISSRPVAEEETGDEPEIKSGWNTDKTEYTIPLTKANVKSDRTALDFDAKTGTVDVIFNAQYNGVWFHVPSDVKEKFSSIEFTYSDLEGKGFGTAVQYSTSGSDENIKWGEGQLTDSSEGTHTYSQNLDSSKQFSKFKIFRDDKGDRKCINIHSVVLKK